ncbi:hypothetical protein [Streptomyces sp. NPDC093600]|uniref:hypothetical protein n=1 Tax=Streptomyces sp. NPDC093600 TaxID=3366047 RepID=UPI003807AD26
MITHATPARRDIRYDPTTERTTIAITLHHLDGTSEPSTLVLTPDEIQLHAIQLEQAGERREAAG